MIVVIVMKGQSHRRWIVVGNSTRYSLSPAGLILILLTEIPQNITHFTNSHAHLSQPKLPILPCTFSYTSIYFTARVRKGSFVISGLGSQGFDYTSSNLLLPKWTQSLGSVLSHAFSPHLFYPTSIYLFTCILPLLPSKYLSHVKKYIKENIIWINLWTIRSFVNIYVWNKEID